MKNEQTAEVFTQCSCCGSDIHFGNAIVQIERLVQQIDLNAEGTGLVIDVIDSSVLATICYECGNQNSISWRLRKSISPLLGLPLPDEIVIHPYRENNTEPDPCDCCGCEIKTGNAQVDLSLRIAQVDWSEEYDDDVQTTIYGDSLFTFCAACGNRMSEERLGDALRQVLIYRDVNDSEEDDDDLDDDSWDDDSENSETPEPVCGYYSKQIIPGLKASFGDIPEAISYVLNTLVAAGHGYIVDIRGGWEIEKNEPSCMQIVPENAVFDNHNLDLMIHIPFDPKADTINELIRFTEFPLYRHFEHYTWKGIPCYAIRCGRDIDKLNRITRLLLVEVFRYTTAASIECNIFDEGLLIRDDKAFVDDLEKDDRVLHDGYGPCSVTFTGKEYIGLCTEQGQHILIRRDADELHAWSAVREDIWKTAQEEERRRLEKEKTRPWPESTFQHEPEDNPHYMGSHWQPFFENGVDDVLPRLPEMLKEGTLTSGYGDTHPALYEAPKEWQAGKHLVWPDADRGAVMSVAIEEDANNFCTVYPFWSDGAAHRLTLDSVLIWESGVEAQITALFGEAEVTFFDALYLHNRSFYERGNDYEFSLAGIAYSAQPADDLEDIPYTPNPDQIAWEKELARMRGEEEPGERPTTIRMQGAALLFGIPDWDKDDYSFRGPVKQVSTFTDFLGQDGWVVKTTVRRQSDHDPEEFDLDIVITALAWDGAAPPEVGQDIEGSLWLQGYLQEPCKMNNTVQAMHTGTASAPVKIIDIVAEGGRMTLFGWKDQQGEWHFQQESNECALIDMLVEDGEDWGGATGIARTESFTGWDKALTLLYRWPWPALYPRYVHPEFADRVMQEVKRAVNDEDYGGHVNTERWENICAGKSDDF
ncbi:MAG: hypothetical protein FIA89_03945 [Geobacter sp.]|nr:hypothetical protein [Geobacter sp.]